MPYTQSHVHGTTMRFLRLSILAMCVCATLPTQAAGEVARISLGYPDAYITTEDSIYLATAKKDETFPSISVRRVPKTENPVRALSILGEGYGRVTVIGSTLVAVKSNEALFCGLLVRNSELRVPLAEGERFIGVSESSRGVIALTYDSAANLVTTYSVDNSGVRKQSHSLDLKAYLPANQGVTFKLSTFGFETPGTVHHLQLLGKAILLPVQGQDRTVEDVVNDTLIFAIDPTRATVDPPLRIGHLRSYAASNSYLLIATATDNKRIRIFGTDFRELRVDALPLNDYQIVSDLELAADAPGGFFVLSQPFVHHALVEAAEVHWLPSIKILPGNIFSADVEKTIQAGLLYVLYEGVDDLGEFHIIELTAKAHDTRKTAVGFGIGAKLHNDRAGIWVTSWQKATHVTPSGVVSQLTLTNNRRIDLIDEDDTRWFIGSNQDFFVLPKQPKAWVPGIRMTSSVSNYLFPDSLIRLKWRIGDYGERADSGTATSKAIVTGVNDKRIVQESPWLASGVTETTLQPLSAGTYDLKIVVRDLLGRTESETVTRFAVHNTVQEVIALLTARAAGGLALLSLLVFIGLSFAARWHDWAFQLLFEPGFRKPFVYFSRSLLPAAPSAPGDIYTVCSNRHGRT
jgi:hypothetical protein